MTTMPDRPACGPVRICARADPDASESCEQLVHAASLRGNRPFSILLVVSLPQRYVMSGTAEAPPAEAAGWASRGDSQRLAPRHRDAAGVLAGHAHRSDGACRQVRGGCAG